MAIYNIGEAWEEVKQSCRMGAWKKKLPGVTGSNNFDPESELANSRHEIVKMAKSV
jgi:hypothetical protein